MELVALVVVLVLVAVAIRETRVRVRRSRGLDPLLPRLPISASIPSLRVVREEPEGTRCTYCGATAPRPGTEMCGCGATVFKGELIPVGQDFRDADLVGASFRNADFRGACFDNADMVGADLRGANTAGATFARADTTGVRR